MFYVLYSFVMSSNPHSTSASFLLVMDNVFISVSEVAYIKGSFYYSRPVSS
jgi:hypothetical protein